MINLKQILDLLSYTDENVALYDQDDVQLLVALFVDTKFIPYYTSKVLCIESSEIYGIKITIKIN